MRRVGRPPTEVRWLENPETGCWVWQLYCDDRGYGRVTVDNRQGQSAHRWSYERHVGPIPEGMYLDHLCCNPSCVNPAHLEPVTHAENMRRGALRRTECKHGHPYTPENTYIRKDTGGRVCRACNRSGARRQRAKERNAV